MTDFTLEFVRKQQPEVRAHFHGDKTVAVNCPFCPITDLRGQGLGPFLGQPLYVQPGSEEVDCMKCGSVFKVNRVSVASPA